VRRKDGQAMKKEELVIEYIDLASRYSFMLCGNEPVDEIEKENIKNRLYAIREALCMEKIILK
jgi:hypothetical protein